MAAVSVGDNGGEVGQEFHETRTFMNNHYNMTTTVVFDPQEELLWTGTGSGHVTSYYGPELHRYTAFRGHITDIKQIVPDAYGVLSLASNQIRYTTRQGLKIFLAEEESMQDMQCMVHYDSNYVTVAGHQDHFYEIDMTSGDVYQREVQVDPGIVMMKHSDHFLCCGDSQGKVTLRDPETLESLHVLEAHGQTLSDFDIHENTLVTTGFSTRYGHLSVDRFLMVYDLRTLRAFPPLQVPLDPFLVHFMPTYTTRCVVVSQAGQFLFCQPESLMYDPLIYQTSTHGAAIMDFDISSTYQALAFADSAGCIHIWSDRGEHELIYNPYSHPTLLADEVQHHPSLAFDDYSISLSSIPMPECHETLLSDWPAHLTIKADRKTPDIDPEILQNMTIRQSVGYAPNPKKRLRNQVAYRLDNSQWNDGYGPNPPESPLKRDTTSSVVPKMYRKVDIKYTKYGIDNFDFKHYNHTKFAGLEIHIPNAYCNSMLQVLYYLEPLRTGVQNHICSKEFCLACELSFLFRMLDIAEDQTCQATNFLRAFRTIREASALGLILSDVDELTRNQSLAKVIQNWHRFVLQQIHQDTMEKIKPADSEEDSSAEDDETSCINTIFGSQLEVTKKCKCGSEEKRDSTVFMFDMQYPDNSNAGDKEGLFLSSLRNSIARQQVVQAWCEECKKYQSTSQTRTLKTLPDILSINCGLDQPREFEIWRQHVKAYQTSYHGKLHKPNISPPKTCRYGKLCNRQGCRFFHGRDGEHASSHPIKDSDGHIKSVFPFWLELRINPENGNLTATELDTKEATEEVDDNRAVYTLSSVVSCVQDAVDGNTLVAAIHVGETYHERKEGTERKGWYLFNDFAITPISEYEAVDFNAEWKVPCCLVYTRVDLMTRYDLSVEQKIDSKILVSDTSLAQRQARFSRQFIPLNPSELSLNEGDVVGLDAEFVTLNQEESEMRSDGTLSTVKPSQMCAARITVVRGWGTLIGVPFIDDYISTSEQVVDYLTRFSGIKPGDLDAKMSSKHLTTLKTTYQKLLHLIDQKIIFIGHGLKKDFRVINIVVPRDQIIDTAELFRVPNQRYVSLKFLAWRFLNIKIQSESHDSAEDAYTAVKLFRKYQEIVDCYGDEQFDRELEVLYDTGRQLNWQVPD